DGRTIAYTVGPNLFIAGTNGSNPRKIWTAAGNVNSPAWSPDGRRLRLTLIDAKDDRRSIWEVGAGGEAAHPLLTDFDQWACCGRWSPEGRKYAFSAVAAQQRGATLAPPGTDIWVVAEGRGWLSSSHSKPVRITQGPLSYSLPVWSRDGRKIF